MDVMTLFNVAAGFCSIISLIIALKANERVTRIEKQYNSNENSHNKEVIVNQTQNDGDGNVMAGRDIIKK